MTKEDTFELSRRKALAGLATIGVAGAGAGLGTSAYFSDEESFVDNVLEAGELDLFVDYEFTADQGSVGGNLSEPTSGQVQGDTADDGDGEQAPVGYQLEDVKPGDSGTLEFCPKVVDNPAWVWAGIGKLVDYENGQTEPEAEVDDSGGDPGPGAGELSEAIQVTVSYCNADGETLREMDNPDDYTLADLAGELQGGFLLDGDDVEDGETDPYPGSGDSGTQEGPCLCIEWDVPTDVGNEIQSDSVEFDFLFYAEQARNNENPVNPFVDVVVSEESGEDDFDEIQPAINDAGAGGTVLVRNGTYEEQVVIGYDDLTLLGESRDGVVVELPDDPDNIPGGNGPEAVTISPAAEAASGVSGGDESLLDENWWRNERGYYEVSGVKVCNLTIDGGGDSNRGLYAVHAEDYTYENVLSKNNGDKGSGNGWSRGATLKNVTLESNDDDGLTAFRSDGFTFQTVAATDNADDGIDIHGNDHTLEDVEARGNGNAGVEFTQGENNSLTGSKSIDNEYGVLIENIGSASASPTAGDVEIEVDGNSLRDNATDLQMDADNDPALDVNADDNWWGDDSDPVDDGKANADSGTLHLDTWLSSPP